MITFSVVTITYNAEKVLQPTLDSVLMQDYSHVEHIIIDGASKDNTVQMARDYQAFSDKAENGHTVLIQSEPDKGLYDAMNKGLQKPQELTLFSSTLAIVFQTQKHWIKWRQ